MLKRLAITPTAGAVVSQRRSEGEDLRRRTTVLTLSHAASQTLVNVHSQIIPVT